MYLMDGVAVVHKNGGLWFGHTVYYQGTWVIFIHVLRLERVPVVGNPYGVYMPVHRTYVRLLPVSTHKSISPVYWYNQGL